MTTKRFLPLLGLVTLLTWTAAETIQAQQYQAASAGTRWMESTSGTTLKVLVESTNLGGTEVDIGEITFPGASSWGGSRGHQHGAVEIFYILTGEFEHTVNGQAHVLTPGMVGIVRPGDEVIHSVLSEEPVKALVIWALGGEVERLTSFITVREIRED